MAGAKTFFTGIGYIIGILLILSGVLGLANPLYMVRSTFGVPSATEETITFYPGLMGRNIAAGLVVLWFLLNGKRKATGVLLFCWTWAGIGDTYLLLARADGENIPVHVFNTFLVFTVGLGLMLS